MQGKKAIPSWILSSKEEGSLSETERSEYYKKLRDFCKNRKLTNTTWGATTIAPKLKKITGVIARKVCNILSGGTVDIIVEGLENIPKGPVIFASTHQGILDGFLDVARKTSAPIVPVVLEYTYENERITHIHICYGETISLNEKDKLVDKLEEYKERISTIRWSLIEKKGLFNRSETTNWEYIDFMKANLRNLSSVDADINLERTGIQGADQEFFHFHHINDVPWNEKGELLGTEETERLKKINLLHGI